MQIDWAVPVDPEEAGSDAGCISEDIWLRHLGWRCDVLCCGGIGSESGNLEMSNMNELGLNVEKEEGKDREVARIRIECHYIAWDMM